MEKKNRTNRARALTRNEREFLLFAGRLTATAVMLVGMYTWALLLVGMMR